MRPDKSLNNAKQWRSSHEANHAFAYPIILKLKTKTTSLGRFKVKKVYVTIQKKNTYYLFQIL